MKIMIYLKGAADKLLDVAFIRMAKRMSQRWKTLKASYYKVIKQNHNSGSDQSNFKHFSTIEGVPGHFIVTTFSHQWTFIHSLRVFWWGIGINNVLGMCSSVRSCLPPRKRWSSTTVCNWIRCYKIAKSGAHTEDEIKMHTSPGRYLVYRNISILPFLSCEQIWP